MSTQGLLLDDECTCLKTDYYRKLNRYRLDGCDENRRSMVLARSLYKKTIRKKKFVFDKKKTKLLENARFNNAKDYWKMLKGSVTQCSSNRLSTDNFVQYFKAINDPDSVFFSA